MAKNVKSRKTALADCPRQELLPPRPGEANGKAQPVKQAFALLRSGVSELMALAQVRHDCNVSEEVAQAAVALAYERLRQNTFSRPPEEHLALSVEQRAQVIERALAEGDNRVALAAMEQRDKLLGLFNVNPFGNDSGADTLLELLRRAAECPDSPANKDPAAPELSPAPPAEN